MKKSVYCILILAASVFMVSCQKDEPMPGGSNAGDVKFSVNDITLNIKVGDPAQTKSVKAGWVAGDRINIWWNTDMTSNPDLVIKYNGTKWVVDAEATVTGNAPAASGTIFGAYEGYNDISKYNSAYSSGWYNILTSKVKASLRGKDIYQQPALLSFGKYSDEVTYTYVDKVFTTDFSTKWTDMMKAQVVVTGLSKAPEKYALKCNNFRVRTYWNVRTNTIDGWDDGSFYCIGFTNEANSAAFHYSALESSVSGVSSDYVFTLYDLESDKMYQCTVPGKTLSKDNYNAIKIDFSNFVEVPLVYVAGLNGKNYYSLEEAVNDVFSLSGKQTITILADCEASGMDLVRDNAETVLDLNGHTVNLSGEIRVFYYKDGKYYTGNILTVKDSGEGGKLTSSSDVLITTSSTGAGTVLNIEGGTFENSSSYYAINIYGTGDVVNVKGGKFTAGSKVFRVYNSGAANTLNITGGEFEVTGKLSPIVYVQSKGNVNISGGTFNAKSRIIEQDYDGTLTLSITGGKFTNTEGYSMFELLHGNFSISNQPVFTPMGKLFDIGYYSGSAAALSIYGGYFNLSAETSSFGTTAALGSISVSGGYFTENVKAASFLKSGYEFKAITPLVKEGYTFNYGVAPSSGDYVSGIEDLTPFDPWAK